ncbi:MULTISPECIES: DUF6241 domain-containing protein [Bacillaceae]|uniref:Death domain-containing protein n=1 Tax=Evansella alkalicola TaxID=745819 RepID=A0ABS6JN87_9BACI|nr:MULTISPECIES: DUF6241 domain-containing protein [Bacillaceae]MBU9720021.1 hypothetical protein [Bacillus alkalicola]
MSKTKWFTVTLLFLIIGIGSYILLTSDKIEEDSIDTDSEAIENEVEDIEIDQLNSEHHEGNSEEVIAGNAPTVEEVEEDFPLNLPEHAVQNYIHWMSHQKIHADQKWGKMLITEERINRLLEVVEVNEYRHEETYRDILLRWQKGDFSKAVEDHNAIWRLQNGTIGEAERLLTEEEEMEYINRHFKTEEEEEDR